MKSSSALIIAFLILQISTPAFSAREKDIDKLTTYSVVLGRAVACGPNADQSFRTRYMDAMRKVGGWMDRAFPPGSPERVTAWRLFTEGMEYHAEQQKSGRSPDSCSAVLRSFSTFPWP